MTRPKPVADGLRTSIAVMAGICASATGVLILYESKSGQSVLAHLRRGQVELAQPIQDVESAEVGAVRTARYEIVNRTTAEVKIIGGAVKCTCMATRVLNFTIPAGGTVVLDMQVEFKGTPGRFGHDFELYIYAEHTGHRTIRGHVTGTVLD